MDIKVFELKQEHLKLLSSMYVMWNDDMSGAPMIDPKKPYGNSDIFKDIARILGYRTECSEEQEAEYSEEQEILMDKLHKETEIALQIVLNTGKFEPGIYETESYKLKWKKRGEKLESIESKYSRDDNKRKTQDGITLIS